MQDRSSPRSILMHKTGSNLAHTDLPFASVYGSFHSLTSSDGHCGHRRGVLSLEHSRRDDMLMLRSGLLLFLVSAVAVTWRTLEGPEFGGESLKLTCYTMLVASVSCFMGTFWTSGWAHTKHA